MKQFLLTSLFEVVSISLAKNKRIDIGIMKTTHLWLAFLLFGLFSCNSSKKESGEAIAEQPLAKESVTSASDVQSASEAGKKRIVFFGNSLTAGYGLEPDQAFSALIQNKIDELGWEYEVVNAGLSGETTAGGTNRIEWVLKQPVDIFVLELGGNDALRGIDPESSQKNLQKIIDITKAKYPDVEIVLAGMMAPPNMGEDYGTKFQQIYPTLAEKNNIALIPFLLEDVGGESHLNLPDGIHPNVEGQKIVAETVWGILKPLLEEVQ
ncbi:arylesterase [Flammeovirgaceae bacterium SG7u.111]|nr:arylesterase [Flammeovirgaceae bacterium SG7u.132]WPO33025.1 arylesterase [Flammeovirgaceae bacterium SG7u.111]